ncbi:hypothetical protein BJ165DRAFT_1044750 [Panaeolus papilionaceus]|nr:hypothetical protein BJ165DRAFT_1044750 [Panaeolus papilionaceus]
MRGHGRTGQPNSMSRFPSALFAQDFAAVSKGFAKIFDARWRSAGYITGVNLTHTIVVACDVAAHLGPATIFGVVYLSPMPYIECITPQSC